MKTALFMALVGLLLVLCGWSLIRGDAIAPSGKRALAYTLWYLGVILIFVAAAKAAF